MSAYYNEHDPYAAQWLRNLIKAGLIPDGVVDERDIKDVKPSELRKYVQCHFFAGLGGWPLALRRAGWPDDKPVWTGSCPCQPFSAAGRGDGFIDERHLWPHWFHLITQCDPNDIYGEQVSSKDGLAWLDLVQTDLENAEYAFGSVDLCAAGVGAPHIRQRSWFVAQRVGDTSDEGLQRHGGSRKKPIQEMREGAERHDGETGDVGGMAHTKSERFSECQQFDSGMRKANNTRKGNSSRSSTIPSNKSFSTSPTNSQWRNADWLYCRDGKWRPVEPGTFPLAYGVSNRVGRLRAYGNAINVEAAQAFIEATL